MVDQRNPSGNNPTQGNNPGGQPGQPDKAKQQQQKQQQQPPQKQQQQQTPRPNQGQTDPYKKPPSEMGDGGKRQGDLNESGSDEEETEE